MKYSTIDSFKYVLSTLSKREKWLFALAFAPFVLGAVIQTYMVLAWNMPVSNDKLLWEFASVAFLAAWIFLLTTLSVLGKELERRETASSQVDKN
jgi:hypothetical protein